MIKDKSNLIKSLERRNFKIDSACTCEDKPEDERFLNINPTCPIHGISDTRLNQQEKQK